MKLANQAPISSLEKPGVLTVSAVSAESKNTSRGKLLCFTICGNFSLKLMAISLLCSGLFVVIETVKICELMLLETVKLSNNCCLLCCG